MGEVITGVSSKRWVYNGKTYSTKGMVHLAAPTLENLPLAMMGTTLSKDDLENLLKDELRNRVQKLICDNVDDKSVDITCLPNNLLASTFLAKVVGRFPDWMNIFASESNDTSLKVTDLVSFLWTGNQLKTVIGETRFSLFDDNIYAVILYRRPLRINLEKDNKILDQKESGHHLIAIDLCNGLQGNAMVVFNPLALESLSTLAVFRELSQMGMMLLPVGIQFSKASLLRSPAMRYWDGKALRERKALPSQMEVVGRLQWSLNESQCSINMVITFKGTTTLATPAFHNKGFLSRNKWDLTVQGDLDVRSKTVVQQQLVILPVKIQHVKGYLRTSGDETEKNGELFVDGTLGADPFVSTLLESYITPDNYSPVSLYSAMDNHCNHTKIWRATQLAFRLQGRAKFGPLLFPTDTVTIVFSYTNGICVSSDCAMQTKLSVKFSDKANFGKLLTTAPNRPGSLEIFLPSDNTLPRGNLNSTLNFLGDQIPVEIHIHNDSLILGPVNILVYGEFTADLSMSARLEAWESLRIKMKGRFKGTGNERDLGARIENFIHRYTKTAIDKIPSRLKARENAYKNTKARLLRAKERYVLAQESHQKEYTKYNELSSAAQQAKHHVVVLKQAVSHGRTEVRQLQHNLNNLCRLDNCPYVCMEGTACTTCYHDVIGTVRGACPATCHHTEQQRVEPTEVQTLCKEPYCNRKHGSKGLFRRLYEISCPLANFVKWAVQTAIQVGLTFVGVPPPVAAGIAGGVTALLDGESPLEIAKASGEGLIGGGTSKAAIKSSKFIGTLVKGAVVSQVAGKDDCASKIGSWNCGVTNTPCVHPLFNYKYTHKPYSCMISCDKETVKETMATSCCSEVNCAYRVKEHVCVKRNDFCREIKNRTLIRLGEVEQDLVWPVVQLEEAIKHYTLAEYRVKRQSITLEKAADTREASKRAVNGLATSLDITDKAKRQTKDLLRDALNLANLSKSFNGNKLLQVEEVRFEELITSGSIQTLPLKVTIKDVSNAGQEKVFNVMLNSHDIEGSITLFSKRIIKAFFGDVALVFRGETAEVSHGGSRRKRRAVDDVHPSEDSIQILASYSMKCARLTAYDRRLTDIVSLLYNITTEAQRVIQTITNHSRKVNRTNEAVHLTLNSTAAANLNLTAEDLNDLNNQTAFSPGDETKESDEIEQQFLKLAVHKVESTMVELLQEWQSSLERLLNSSSDDCIGLSDCVDDITDHMSSLVEGAALPGANRMRYFIATITGKVKILIESDNMTLVQAVTRSKRVLNLLDEAREIKMFCASAPNITINPRPLRELGVGSQLSLSCGASGDPSPSYRWKRNGVILQGYTNNAITITNVSTEDSGSYVCEAYNHVTVQASTPSHVIVHAAPNITRQPPEELEIAVNSHMVLICNASSSTYQPLVYQWLHKPTASSDFIALENQTFPIVQIPRMQPNDSGKYVCNVSSRYGYSLSRESLVRVLYFSLIRPSVQIDFEMSGNPPNSSTRARRSVSSSEPDWVVLGREEVDEIRSSVNQSLQDIFTTNTGLPMDTIVSYNVSECLKTQGQYLAVLTCKVDIHLQGVNPTNGQVYNRSLMENAESFMAARRQLREIIRNITSPDRNVSVVRSDSLLLIIDTSSWEITHRDNLCPTGQRQHDNGFQCINCSPGKYGVAGVCRACPVGSYQQHEGQSTCVTCRYGYSTSRVGGQSIQDCEDTDECLPGGMAGCAHVCNNTQGSYQCLCREGYHLGQDNKTCIDIDECLAERATGCAHVCKNTPGGFQCLCREGYHLGQDSKTCIAIPKPTEDPSTSQDSDTATTPHGISATGASGRQKDAEQSPKIIVIAVSGVACIVLVIVIAVLIKKCRRRSGRVEDNTKHDDTNMDNAWEMGELSLDDIPKKDEFVYTPYSEYSKQKKVVPPQQETYYGSCSYGNPVYSEYGGEEAKKIPNTTQNDVGDWANERKNNVFNKDGNAEAIGAITVLPVGSAIYENLGYSSAIYENLHCSQDEEQLSEMKPAVCFKDGDIKLAITMKQGSGSNPKSDEVVM